MPLAVHLAAAAMGRLARAGQIASVVVSLGLTWPLYRTAVQRLRRRLGQGCAGAGALVRGLNFFVFLGATAGAWAFERRPLHRRRMSGGAITRPS